jgi:hypothetical protein
MTEITVNDLVSMPVTNLLIIVVGVLILAVLVFVYAWNRSINIKGIEVGKNNEPELWLAIPRIDDRVKSACRDVVDNAHDVIAAKLPESLDRAIKLLISAKMRIPLYRCIQRNHLTLALSDDREYDIWYERLHCDVMDNIYILIDYCNYQEDDPIRKYLVSNEFQSYLKDVLPKIIDRFLAPIRYGCREKIETYRKSKTDRSKELVEKNEGYLRNIR